jgi:hypothetical protein
VLSLCFPQYFGVNSKVFKLATTASFRALTYSAFTSILPSHTTLVWDILYFKFQHTRWIWTRSLVAELEGPVPLIPKIVTQYGPELIKPIPYPHKPSLSDISKYYSFISFSSSQIVLFQGFPRRTSICINCLPYSCYMINPSMCTDFTILRNLYKLSTHSLCNIMYLLRLPEFMIIVIRVIPTN